MVDISVRPRRGAPTWIWLIVGIIVLLIVLIAIDYFVTNLVLNRPPAGPGGGQAGPFGTLLSGGEIFAAGLLTLTFRG